MLNPEIKKGRHTAEEVGYELRCNRLSHQGRGQAMSQAIFEAYWDEHRRVLEHLPALFPELGRVVQACVRALEQGGKLMVCGNGGSAADAQHFAAELSGRYRRERRPLAALALTTDSSALTCIGNDYAFEQVFARQLEALARPGDVLFGISTSGRSKNVRAALEAAARLGVVRVGLTGGHAEAMRPLTDFCLAVPSASTARVQEMHVLLIHMICEALDGWALGE